MVALSTNTEFLFHTYVVVVVVVAAVVGGGLLYPVCTVTPPTFVVTLK